MEERLDGLDVFVQQLDEILKNTTDTKQIAIVSLVADVKGKIGSTIDHPLSLSLLGALWILGSQVLTFISISGISHESNRFFLPHYSPRLPKTPILM